MDGLSNVWLPLLYQFGKSWWILYYLNLGLAIVLIIPLILWVLESPKFLISRNRFSPARAAFAKIARWNGRPMFANPLEGEEQDKKTGSLRDLIRNPSLRLPLIVIPVIWFTVDIVYYGINFSLGNLQGSIYVNGYLSGGAEVISYCIAGVMANTLGRKYSIVFCFLLGGVACLLYKPATSLGLTWTYVCVLLGKFGAACTFNMVYLITTEMFPTVYRGSVFGLANICARVGGILAPLVDGFSPDGFMYIFGALGVLSGICSLLLRETKGEVMADTDEQERRKSVVRVSSLGESLLKGEKGEGRSDSQKQNYLNV